jgi:hypothetical protein
MKYLKSKLGIYWIQEASFLFLVKDTLTFCFHSLPSYWNPLEASDQLLFRTRHTKLSNS